MLHQRTEQTAYQAVFDHICRSVKPEHSVKNTSLYEVEQLQFPVQSFS